MIPNSVRTMKDLPTILVFSPDVDVAQSIAHLLDGEASIVSETQLAFLSHRLSTTAPSAVVVDLFPFPSDILKTLEILQTLDASVQILFLYVYRNWNPEIEKAVRVLSEVVLYKPIDLEQVASTLRRPLAVHPL